MAQDGDMGAGGRKATGQRWFGGREIESLGDPFGRSNQTFRATADNTETGIRAKVRVWSEVERVR